MKALYIDCSMGAAGDMLSAALLELIPDRNSFIEKINSVGIPNVAVSQEKSVKCGITGTHISVKINGEEEHEHNHHHDNEHRHHEHHHHSGMRDIEHIVEHLNVSEKVKTDVMAVYRIIAEAESFVHGQPVTEIHFHEVGTMDAVADITAVCMLMEIIGAEKVIASPVHVGSGHVHCAHGVLPVPAPATARILSGCPIYGGNIKSELCTPTGAALLKYFADDFADMPIMTTEKIGYGMGNKDFETANCVRIFLGEIRESENVVTELKCNIDDMTAEDIGFAVEQLLTNGALDVYTMPIGMKKNRTGILLNVMCRDKEKEKFVKLIFKYTTTIGIRENVCRRYTLNRTVEDVNTEYGVIRKKVSFGYGVERAKFEYDDLSRIAKENETTVDDVRKKLKK